jgi:hypothetical protein
VIGIAVVLTTDEISDAFAYRDSLYCLGLDNTLRVFKIRNVITALQSQHGERGLAAAYALFSSRGIGATAEMRAAFGALETEGVDVLPLSIDPDVTLRLGVDAEFVIDMRIYYDRLYLATEKGAFATWANFDAFEEQSALSLERLHEACVFSLSTGLRAVGMSLGELGLLVRTNESNESQGLSRDIEITSQSVRSSISSNWVANFPSDDEYELYRSVVGQGTRPSDVSLTGVDEYSGQQSQPLHGDAGGFLFWDNRNQRMVESSGTELSTYRPQGARVRRAQAAISEQVVSTAVTGNHFFAIEMAARVQLSKWGRSFALETGPCLSVRSYVNSLRYKRLVTCSAQSGLWLVAGFEQRNEE